MPTDDARDTVVLLHGIGHTRWDMIGAAWALHRAGYRVINLTYPSLKHPLKSLADFVQHRLSAAQVWQRDGTVHFVTHSMGGLVARAYLDQYKESIPSEKMGRVVMMAPPHGGSEIADFLRNFSIYRWGFGPAGQELTTSVRAQDLSVPWYAVGIIAGRRGWPYLSARFLMTGDHDGRVAVARTVMEGMADHIVVNATHSFMPWGAKIHRQVICFLQKGRFDRG